MGDEEGAPYLWVSAEPLLEGVEEAPSGPYVKAPGKCVRARRRRRRRRASAAPCAGSPPLGPCARAAHAISSSTPTPRAPRAGPR